MPFDPALSTDPQLRQDYAPQIRAAEQADRAAAQAAKAQARDAEQAQKVQARAAEEAAKQVQTATNLANERLFKQTNRPSYKDEAGNIVPEQDDAAFAASQQAQAAKAAKITQYQQEGRRYRPNPVDDSITVLDSDAVLEQRKRDAAEKMRRASIDQRIQAHDAEVNYQSTAEKIKPLSETGVTNLKKQLAAAKSDATYALSGKLTPKTQQTDKAGFWDVMNNNPTPEASAAAARLERLSQPDAALDDQDLADLDADPTTAPTAQKIRTITGLLGKHDEAAKFKQSADEKRAELVLRRDSPEKWAEFQRQKIQSMDATQLDQHVQASDADLAAKQTDLESRYQQISEPLTRTQTEQKALKLKNEEALKSGVPAGELVTMQDGSQWHKPLAAALFDLQAKSDQHATDHEPQRQQIEAEAEDLKVELALRNEAAQRAQDLQKTAKSDVQAVQSFMPGMERASAQSRSIQADFEARAADLADMYPEDSPQRQAAVEALQSETQAKLEQTNAAGVQTHAAAQAAYQGYKQRLAEDPKLNAQAGELFVTARKNLAQALGIDEKEADRILNDIESHDWTTRQGKHGEDMEGPGNGTGIAQFMNEAAGDKRQFRMLSNGGVIINPMITDPAAYKAAVDRSPASPEAKRAAMAVQPDLRKNYGAQSLDTLTKLQDEGWQKFQATQPKDVPLEEQAARYADTLKDSATPAGKITRQLLQSMAQGVDDIGAQALGLVSGLTGSESAMKGAQSLNERSQLIELDKQIHGATDSFGLRAAGQFARLVPSLVPAAGGAKAAQVGLGLFARTALGAKMLPALGAAIRGASTPAQAAKATANIVQAGVAGSAAAGGAQTYGATIADVYTTLREKHPEMSHATALRQAQMPAILSGAVTAILTTVGGATGVEKLLANPAAVKEAFKKQFTSQLSRAGYVAKQVALGGIKEWPEEIADEVFSTVATAAASGQSVPLAMAQFVESLPELSAAIFALGGAGEGIQAIRETLKVPRDVTQPAAAQVEPADPALRPEVAAAAWSSIDQLSNREDLNPADIPAMQERASVALAIAQGGSVEDLEETQLNAAGWTGRNSKGVTLPEGQIERLKDYTGPEVLEVDSAGVATISPAYRASLAQHLPEVAAAIPANHGVRIPSSVNTPAPSDAPNQETPKPQQSNEITASGSAASGVDTSTPEGQRIQDFTAHFQDLGLAPAEAAQVAKYLVDKQGVIGETYVDQAITKEYPKILRELGLSGSLSTSRAQDNPLRVPADFSQRLASQSAAKTAPLSPVADPSASQAPESSEAQAARGSSAQGAASPTSGGEDTTQGAVVAPPAAAAPAAPKQEQVFKKAQPSATAPKLDFPQQERAEQLAAKIVKDGSYTEEEAAALAAEYVAQSKENNNDLAKQFKLGFIPWLSRKETEARGGVLAKGRIAPDGTPLTDTDVVAETPSRPADLRRHSAWNRARLQALTSLPAAKRPAARKTLNILERALADNHALFGSLALGDSANSILDGAAIAVDMIDGQPVLALNLSSVLDDLGNLSDLESGITATMVEEAIHASVLTLSKQKPFQYNTAALVKRWRAQTPELRQKVWESYHAVDILNKTHPKVMPDNLNHGQQWALFNEFLRMLIQDRKFAGQVSESVAQDKSLAQWLADMLKDLGNALKALVSKASPEVQADLETMIEEVGNLVLEMQARSKGDPSRLATLPALKPMAKKTPVAAASVTTPTPAKSATIDSTTDNRASVLAASAPLSQTPKQRDFKPSLGSTGTAYTDSNDAIEYQWAVVDVRSLTLSNLDDGRINPDYPQELQPRDRTSAGSEAQVTDIAKNLNLDRLSASNGVGDGAPIVGPDGVVESGNGRGMGARRAHGNQAASAKAYKQRLIDRSQDFGLTAAAVNAIEQPVLVRVRRTEVNRVAFVLAANVSTIAPKREIEQAKIDAKQIVPDLFQTFVPSEDGDVFTAANADFIRGFMSAIVPPAERPALIDAKGNLSQTGLRRLRNALFVYAYGDSKDTLTALSSLTEAIEADGRNIVNALIAMAPRLAEQNGRMDAGALYPLSLTEDLAKALSTYQDIKARGETVETWAAQDTLAGIGDAPSALDRRLVTFLHDFRRKPRAMVEALNRYASAVDMAGDPKQQSLFGDEPRPTKEELLTLATGQNFDQAQPSLASGTKAPTLAPATALKLYRTLTAKETLTPGQSKALETAEMALGQTFLFDAATTRISKPAEDLRLETQTTGQALGSEQLSLFSGSKRVVPEWIKPIESLTIDATLARYGIQSSNSFRNPRIARAQLESLPVTGGRGSSDSGDARPRSEGGRRSGGAGIYSASQRGLEALPKLDSGVFTRYARQIPAKDRLKGQEHTVYRHRDPRGDTAIKLTNAGEFGARGSLGGYLEQMARQNEIFGDDIAIEGWIQFPGESGPRLVTSQRWQRGRPSTLEEIDGYMRRKGFQRAYEGAWWDGSTVISDALPKNFITATDGSVYPIDLIIETPRSQNRIDQLDNQVASQAQPQPTPEPPALYSGSKTVDPRLMAQFGADWPAGWNEYGFPNIPQTLPAGHELLEPTVNKTTAILHTDHRLVVAGILPADRTIPRAAFQRAVVQYFMQRATPVPAGTQPTLYAMGGGGGAGKSTILGVLKERGDVNTDNTVEINADDIKELIPEYHEMKLAGDGRAAATVHEESSQITSLLMERAIPAGQQARYNVVFDGTLSNAKKTKALFTRWKASGLKIHFIGVTIDPKEAITRAVLRGQDSGRWVPLATLIEAHRAFNDAVKSYLPEVDLANIYDNTPPKPIEIVKKEAPGPQFSIVNPQFWTILDSRSYEEISPNNSRGNSTAERDPKGPGQTPLREVQPSAAGEEIAPDWPEMLAWVNDMTVQEFAALAAKGKLNQATGRPSPFPVGSMNTPLAIGAAEGYSMRDIAHFYLARRTPRETTPAALASSAPDAAEVPQIVTAFDEFANDGYSESQAPSLAKGRTAPDDTPDLFSFNNGLGLDALLTPAQNEAKLQQAQTLDLFGEFTDARPRSTPQRAPRPARTGSPTAAAETTGGFGDLFGQTGMAPAAGWDGSLFGDGAGFTGGSGGSGDNAAGGTTTSGPGTDTSAGNDTQGSTGADMLGLSGDAGGVDAIARPSVGNSARNFEVPDTVDNLAPATDKAKIAANIEAIRLLKQLEDERRDATPEEKSKLAAYTGWGAFKEAFNSKYEEDISNYWDDVPEYRRQYMPDWLKSWEKNHRPLHKLLRESMTPDEFASASASTLNAHYTAAPIIRAMWKMVDRLGFKGGRALEPSAGNGHYLGLTPRGIADKTQWQTVELDDLSARLLSKLYPEATVNESRGGNESRQVAGLGFERARIPNGSLDLVISNVPFHESGPSKKGFPSLNLHNFFFAHALDKVKPGGLVAFITSESTMQNNVKQRDFIASKGDLVAAFRLPNNAFKGNAGTEVTTDIIILRKPDATPFQGQAWRNLIEVGRQTITLVQGKDQTVDELRREAARTGDIVGKEYFKGDKKAIDVSAPIMVNEYFVNHPQHALGTHTLASSMYRAGGYALVAPETLNVTAALDALIPSLPENVMGKQSMAETKATVLADRDDKPFSYKEQDGKIYEVQPDGSMEEAEWSTNPEMVQTWRSWRKVADAAEQLVRAETSDSFDETGLDRLRRNLNVLYDNHVMRHKPISRRFANSHKHLTSDPSYALTAALESEVTAVDSKTGKRSYTYQKAEIFTKRIGRPIVEPSSAQTTDEALELALAWRGTIDSAYAASLLGSTVERFEAEALLRPDIFRNPDTSLLEQGEEYLSGNVRQKLETAQEAAKDDPRFAKNVEALTAAQPERKEIARIAPVLGARWIPAPVYDAFIKEVLQGSDTVEYIPAGNSWIISGPGLYKTEDHGSERKKAAALFKHALDMTEPLVYNGSGDNRTFNPSATAAAKTALDKMRRAFIDFVKTSDVQVELSTTNEESGTSLPVWEATENAFNESNNSYVTPKHTGAYLKFPGLNTDYVYTKPHRRGVIARFLTTRRGMMAHGVGSGKTFNQIILAQEMRRLGLAKKPMIVVQNATLGQFAKSYLKAYPGAKVLVPSKSDFQAQNRRKLVAKIATGDWDAVILPHSQFDLISNKESAVKAYMDSQIEELMAIVNSTKDKAKVRDLEGMIKRLKDRRQGMLDQLKARQDTDVMWEDLGIDALIMDEAHNYKSLPIITRMGRVKGVPASGNSQRAINFMLKCRDVQSRTGGKNIFLATGTPIKNSMAEAFIMMQFMAPDVLEDFGIHNFDDFATSYGQTVTEAEMAWGGTPKMETRFAKFQNGSALITMVRTMFDVAFGNESLGLDVPKIKGGEPEMVIVPATESIDRFNAWTLNVNELWKKADPTEKEEFGAVPIQTMAAGIAAALDPRLLSPNLPDDPGSKVNTAVGRVVEIYKAGAKNKTTQIIFSDLRNPFSMEYLMPFTGHPFPEYGGDGEFDLYDDVKNKLVAAGVPEKEIHLMKSGMTDAAKAALFEKVDAGEIRIIMGSTELLGVGVNIQTRLKAVHHLMPPRDFTPAMMEQRNGRIIRQGNLHAEKVEGKPAWNEEVEVVNYGTEGSMDSTIYGTLARKQRFITQLLMGEEMQDTFDDPTDPVAVNMAEMAARTLGDPDFIRRIELEKEIKDLRLQSEAFTNELSGKRSRLSRLETNLRYGDSAIAAAQEEADKYAKLWTRNAARPEGVKEDTDITDKAVYEFGGLVIDTAGKEGSVTAKLDNWLLDTSKRLERRGMTLAPASLTINGQEVPLNVYITMPNSITAGAVMDDKGRDLIKFSGAASLIQNLRRLPADLLGTVQRTRQNLADDAAKAEKLRETLAAIGTFPEAEKLAALELEAQEVDARLRAKSAPQETEDPSQENQTRVLPPMKPVEVGLMTYDVERVIDNADIIGNKLFLPDTLDRKLYKAVNAALESAGGVWSKRDKAHLFAGDPRPYLGLAEMPALASGTKSATFANDQNEHQLDRRTASQSEIRGSRVTAEQGREIRDVHFARVAEDGPLRQGSAFARSDFDWTPGPDLAKRLGAAFDVPVITAAQEAAIQALPVNTDGVESKVYLDRENGVIYKRLQDGKENPAGGIWPHVGHSSLNRLDWSFLPAKNPRAIGVRLAVMSDFGGTPTEIAAIGPQGHIYLKQPLSPNPGIGSQDAFIDRSGNAVTRRASGIMEIPTNLITYGAPRAYITVVKGRPWLVLDLHSDNLVGDNQGAGRINDPVIGIITQDTLRNVKGLGAVVQQATQEVQQLGDRSARLFAGTKAVDSRLTRAQTFPMASTDGAAQNNELSTGGLGAQSGTLFKSSVASAKDGPSPLAALGWNHLDRHVSAKMAALTRHLDDKTGVSETVAKWQGKDDAKPFLAALKAVKGQFMPDSILPREVAAAKREMEIKTAIGSQKAMDLVRALSGNPKFSDLVYPAEFSANPIWRKKMYLAMTGEAPLSSLPAELQKLSQRLRDMLIEQGRDAVKQGRMSLETFENLREGYMPHYYKEDVQREKSLTKRFRLGLRDITAQRTTAWHISDRENKDAGGEPRLVNWQGNQWRFKNQQHRDAFYEDFILQNVLDTLQMRGGQNKKLTLADLNAPAKLPEELRGRIKELIRAQRYRFQKVAPLSVQEKEDAGLIMDPVYSISRYMAQMVHDNSTAEFFNFVASKPEWISDVQVAGFTEIPDNPRFGRLAGKFVMDDIAGQLLEMIESPNTALRLYDTLMGWWKTGKALALDTPIPTPTGWTTMGALQEGDILFDELGQQCHVIHATPVMHNHPCYRVEFSDGTSIVSDEDHLWATYRGGDKKRLKISTTAEIRQTLHYGAKQWNTHSIPNTQPLQTPARDLPLSPYVLGAWLGDGTSRHANITVGGSGLAAMTDLLTKEGVRVGIPRKDKRNEVHTLPLQNYSPRRKDTIQSVLRRMELIGPGLKHIPSSYLRSAPEQRLALLQGLMDTDGSVSPKGLIEFSTSIPALRDGVLELCRSLGLKPSWSTKPTTAKDSYRIRFHADAGLPVFRLPRKVARMKPVSTTSRSQTRQIIAVEPVASVPVRCIQVSSPNKLYLAGVAMVPTHNTVLNPGTHVRNVLGNIFFSQLAGASVWNPGNLTYYRQSLAALRDGGRTLQEAYENGVLGADFVSAELRQTLRQILPDPATIQDDGKPDALLGIGKALGKLVPEWAKNPLSKSYNHIANAYQAEDEVFKLAAYLKAQSMGLSPEEAAAHVRQWFPYFDGGTSGTLKLLGRTAMPFLGFYRESIRIFGNALKERPIALAAGLSVPSLITFLSALALGLDDDDLEELKKDMRGKAGKLLGPTPLEGMPLFSMLLPVRSDQGQIQQFDISAVHPFVDFLGNRVEGGEGEDWWQKTLRSLVAAGPIGSLLYAQMTGKDTFGNRTFVEQNMTAGEKIAARLDNVAKTVLPPLVPGGTGFQTLLNAGTRSTGKTLETRSPTQAVARAVVGLDVRNATPDLYRFADDWRKANKLPTSEGMDFGSTTPTSRARSALFAQLAQDKPNLVAIANLKKKLVEFGAPIQNAQDVQRLLFYKHPLMIISGRENQQRFRASLTGPARAELDRAMTEYEKIKSRSQLLLRP